jgi:hypothetical protein
VEENQLSSEEAQNLWNEEASKLNADDDTSASELLATAPETPQDFEPEQAQVEPEQPEDPLAGLSPTVRAKLAQIDELAQANAQLLHHVKTTEGRVAAMQREAQQARQAATQDAPTQTAIASAAKNPEKWEQLKQDFPEWAGAMEEYVASKMGDQQQQNLTPEQVTNYVQQQVAQTRAEMGRLMEEARIEGKYENWRDTVNTTEFAQWFTVQSPETRALADSSAARDAIKMLDLFNTSKSVSATEIKQERGARLAAAATTRTGQTPPPKTLGDMSPAELWNYEAKKRERELKDRGY